jgi:hypothetical protein
VTVLAVKEAIKEIHRVAQDDETAHSLEDKLRANVLKAISNGKAEDPKEMARLALTTSKIDFCRWCA